MKPSLLRNYLFLSLGVTFLFVLLGFFSLQIFHQINLSKFENNPPLFFAQFVDEAKPEDRTKFFERVKSENFPFDVWLFTEDGKVQASSTTKGLPEELNKLKLPQEPLVASSVSSFWHQGPPTTVVRLHGSDPLYLIFSPRAFEPGRESFQGPPPPIGEPPGPPPPGFGPGANHGLGPFTRLPPLPPPSFGIPGPRGVFRFGVGGPPPLLPLLIFIVAILLASGVSVLILFMYIKKSSLVADNVLEELKRGNLRARFPVTKMNEVGNLMTRFNLMADEIEKLFSQLKEKEASRTRLLQELAHDLRTPVSSMQNMLSLLQADDSNISSDNKNEMLAMSHRESLYIGQLINDLLLLSQITGPESFAQKNQRPTLYLLLIQKLKPSTRRIWCKERSFKLSIRPTDSLFLSRANLI